jgi:acetoin utilization protein AcuB
MHVRDIMSKTVVTVEMDDSLRTVKEIFDHLHFHHLLVVDEGKLFGVISDRDVLKAPSPRLGTMAESSSHSATLNKRVHQIMNRPVGILGWRDILRAVASKLGDA